MLLRSVPQQRNYAHRSSLFGLPNRYKRRTVPKSFPLCVPVPTSHSESVPSRSRSYSRSRSPSPRRSRDRGNERRASPPARYERERSRDRSFKGRDDRYRNDRRGGRFDNYRNGGGRRGGGRDGRDNPRPSNCLGVFGMSMNTTERDLRDIFEKYGHVDSVKIIMDHGTGRSRGFGFINFEDRFDATKARDKVDDMTIDGMRVRVDYAIQRRRTPPPRHRSPPRGGGRYASRSPVRGSRYSRSPSR